MKKKYVILLAISFILGFLISTYLHYIDKQEIEYSVDVFSSAVQADKNLRLLLEIEERDWDKLLNIYANMPATDVVSDDIKGVIANYIEKHPARSKASFSLALAASTNSSADVRNECFSVIEQMANDVFPALVKMIDRTVEKEGDEKLRIRKIDFLNKWGQEEKEDYKDVRGKKRCQTP